MRYSKKNQKPRVSLAVDGGAIRPNVNLLDNLQNGSEMNSSSPAIVLFSITEHPTPVGYTPEKFYADTGANRSIHPNGKVATQFYRQKLDITTTNKEKLMQSEGVGKLDL